ncbi:L-histidine N(alpha)-methyltransferase [Methylobacterium marchantiae]|uniref:L-histidine N(Alpha)-methyltransferase n=1 Tax=Methylobacterium marchantiae TaxID=600331 RepID=A0ABW3X180_9HYPH|nr:Histidine N-alpha-methyltransferase [Methylobacterium marchantiae]
MTINPVFTDATPLSAVAPEQQFLDDVLVGLAAAQKFVPAKYFYDEIGSDLFEAITRQPEYYPTRTEIGILDASGPDIAAVLPAQANLVEFGSGSTVKVRRLLSHLRDLAAYVPVDVSESFLRSEAETLSGDFPNLSILPVAADFTRPFTLPEGLSDGPVAGFFPGSTIGNFEPPQAAHLLAHFGRVLGRDATLIVGVDLVKDKAVLDAAYDDAAGVTARFNLNLLDRINRELGADFDTASFAHRAFFAPETSRIEMHLVSLRAQEVVLAGRRFGFSAGETIHTENSYKYTIEGFRGLADQAGWNVARSWTDPHRLFSVHALTRR